MVNHDPYLRLKPGSATPPDELCACPPPRDWKLMFTLGENPIHCTRCNLEIRPEELGLTVSVVDEVADFCRVWGSIFSLWLDSREYEEWAIEELSRLGSPANVRARALVERLAQINRCYLQAFEDDSAEGWVPKTTCPACSHSLESYGSGKFQYGACHGCRILYWGASGAA